MNYPKKIMIIGNGGRECALANACLLSPKLEQLIITPANWGVLDPIGGRVLTLDVKASDHAGIVAAANEHSVDLAIIGPEDPLCNGLADDLRGAGIAVLGPGKAEAKLEGSKLYAKQFMERAGIPTGGYEVFKEAQSLLDYCERLEGPVVLKADGLAAGKGVVVCKGKDDALAAAKRMMVGREFGSAGDSVLAEERLYGEEISWTCIVSGGKAELLGASTDYKPLLDGNEGPNTGGMGNICPTPFATEEITREFYENILAPFVAGLASDGLDYRGFLFVGTMITEDGLKVIEFNVRFGDPEAEVVLPMNEADWPLVFAGVAAGEWSELPKMKKDCACVAVILASGNYPYGKSEPAVIEGFDRVRDRGVLKPVAGEAGTYAAPQVSLFFAGVSREAIANANGAANGYSNGDYTEYFYSLASHRFMATGGRVLGVSVMGRDLSDARRLAYEVVGNLRFEGRKFRSDIGKMG